jgi:hypothetical protein
MFDPPFAVLSEFFLRTDDSFVFDDDYSTHSFSCFDFSIPIPNSLLQNASAFFSRVYQFC